VPPPPPTAVSTSPAGEITEHRHVHADPAAPPVTASPQPAPEEWDRSAGARQRGLLAFGGTTRTETAVENGLAWLAAHQAQSGIWDRFRFPKQCPPGDRCAGVARERREEDLDAGITGLCLLAFLGAGHVDGAGRYGGTVASAVDALLACQQASGGFYRVETSASYNDALATLALAEYYALTGRQDVREPLERAVKHLASTQQALGGWDYVPHADSGRNDTSITAWVVQALHACAASGIEVPSEVMIKAALHFSRAAEPDGRVRYADAGDGYALDRDLRPVYQYSPALTAAGMTCEQLLGWRLAGPLVLRQRSRLLAELPSEERFVQRDASRRQSMYYWYYGTLGMFQRGGDDWSKWNGRLRDAILPLQDRSEARGGERRHQYGSWPPYGSGWGMAGLIGGRVYSTAIGVLTMEVYYRHTPAFMRDEAPYAAGDWQRYAAGVGLRERRDVLRCLRALRVELCEPPLIDLLSDGDANLAREAGVALAEIDSPLGATVLARGLESLPAWQQSRCRQALARAEAVKALPPVEGVVRLYDAGTRLATLDLPRAYVGMGVDIWRDEERIAGMRVVLRYTGHTIVVAEHSEVIGEEVPVGGDLASGR
jgi:hypothetical protein